MPRKAMLPVAVHEAALGSTTIEVGAGVGAARLGLVLRPGVGLGAPTAGWLGRFRYSAPPTTRTPMTAAAATDQRMDGGMAMSLRGTREARRRGIDGRAARTISSTWSGACTGSPSSQSAMRWSKSGSVSRVMRVAPLGSRDAPFSVEDGPQLADRVVESGPRSPDGDAQGRRDLRQRVAEVVMEDDDRALFRSQPQEGVVEVVAGSDGGGEVRRCRWIHLEDPHAGDPSTLAAGLHVAGMDDEAVEPGVEAVGIAEGGKVAPRAQQGLLGGILRTVRVAQDPEGERVTAVDDGCRERRERIPVTLPGPLDELGLHRTLRMWRPVWSRH